MRTVVRKYREVLTIKTFVRSHVDMQTTKNLDTRTNVLYVTKPLKHQELINRPVENSAGMYTILLNSNCTVMRN